MYKGLSNRIPNALRGMEQFVEEEIVIPSGVYKGLRFDYSVQPISRLFFQAIDSGRWARINTVGCVQSGKTLISLLCPVAYHLFEHCEVSILGAPTMKIAADKWKKDFLPIIRYTQYKKYLPKFGAGSKGGMPELVSMSNGAFLKFMSGGGGDDARAAFESRVAAITEVDKMDEEGGGSRESDKITQIEQRTRSHGDRRRIYLECTPSIEQGRIWQEYINGTKSSILIRCQHCNTYVLPEREHFTGWENCATELEAREKGKFCCPECGAIWTDRDRTNAVRDCKLVHDRESNTLGFRWTAVHNLFWNQATIAEFEWKASRDLDQDKAMREINQFYWARPYIPPKVENAFPEIYIEERSVGRARGRVPEGQNILVVGVDCGKSKLHWTVAAFDKDATGSIIDYGVVKTECHELGEERGLFAALDQIKDMVSHGYSTDSGEILHVKFGLVDHGWRGDIVQLWCQKNSWMPCKGFGQTQDMGGRNYNKPSSTGSITLSIGDGWHINKSESGYRLCLHNADFGKTWLQARMSQPKDEPGSLTLWGAAYEHETFIKHLTSEQRVFEKGIERWVKIRTENHWLDSTSLACLGARIAGVSPVPRRLQKPKQSIPQCENQYRPSQQIAQRRNSTPLKFSRTSGSKIRRRY